jgi:hypothetical protein
VLTRSGCATQKLTIQKFYNVMSTWLPTCIVCLRLVDPTSGNVLQLEINLAILQFVSQTLLAYAWCNSGLMSTSANLCQLQPTSTNFNQLRCHKQTIQKFCNVMSTWLPTCIICLRLVDPTSDNVLQLEINLGILQFVSQTLLAYALCNSGPMSISANLCQLLPT